MGERRNNCNQAKGVDTSVKKWLVVVVAGQSNAVGYDESTPVESEFPENPRICQLGYYGNDNLKIVPLRWCAQNFQNVGSLGKGQKGCKGVHYPLGQELLKWIPSDYGVLFIPAAYGGTSICFKGSKYWNDARGNYNAAEHRVANAEQNIRRYDWQCLSSSEQNPLQGIQATNPMKAIQGRLKYVLKNYPESALLAIVWVQGESTTTGASNTSTGIQNDAQAVYAYSRMFAGIQSVCYLSGIKNIVGNDITHNDIFTYRATRYWNSALYNKIQALYMRMLPKNNYIIPPQTDTVTNKYNGAPKGAGQTSVAVESHYGNNAFRDYIAPALSEAIKKHYDSLNAKYFTIKNQHELITDYGVG